MEPHFTFQKECFDCKILRHCLSTCSAMWCIRRRVRHWHETAILCNIFVCRGYYYYNLCKRCGSVSPLLNSTAWATCNILFFVNVGGLRGKKCVSICREILGLLSRNGTIAFWYYYNWQRSAAILSMMETVIGQLVCQGFVTASLWHLRKTRQSLYRFGLYTEQACCGSFSGCSGSSSTSNTDSDCYTGITVREQGMVGNPY